MKHTRAFSLVELSIVLVILGLLVGGILAGQSLIHASELRSVSGDVQRIRTATSAFRDKYQALPGDMPNATSFWGIAGGITGADSTCGQAPSSDALTCNGNGDRQIYPSNNVYESYRLWQHLSNAGLIEGQFTGTFANFSGYAVASVTGVNTPGSKLDPRAFYYPVYNGAVASSAFYYAGDQGNMMYMDKAGRAAATPDTAPLRPEDMWNIDTKMDDGTPGGGAVTVYKGNGTTVVCTTGDGLTAPADAGATYATSNPNRDCRPIFMRML